MNSCNSNQNILRSLRLVVYLAITILIILITFNFSNSIGFLDGEFLAFSIGGFTGILLLNFISIAFLYLITNLILYLLRKEISQIIKYKVLLCIVMMFCFLNLIFKMNDLF